MRTSNAQKYETAETTTKNYKQSRAVNHASQFMTELSRTKAHLQTVII